MDLPKGLIELFHIDSIKPKKDKMFKLSIMEGKKKFTLKANSKEERDKWMQTIMVISNHFKEIEKNPKKRRLRGMSHKMEE